MNSFRFLWCDRLNKVFYIRFSTLVRDQLSPAYISLSTVAQMNKHASKGCQGLCHNLSFHLISYQLPVFVQPQSWLHPATIARKKNGTTARYRTWLGDDMPPVVYILVTDYAKVGKIKTRRTKSSEKCTERWILSKVLTSSLFLSIFCLWSFVRKRILRNEKRNMTRPRIKNKGVN